MSKRTDRTAPIRSRAAANAKTELTHRYKGEYDQLYRSEIRRLKALQASGSLRKPNRST